MHNRRLGRGALTVTDRKSTRLNSSHGYISYAVFCLKKKKKKKHKNKHRKHKKQKLLKLRATIINHNRDAVSDIRVQKPHYNYIRKHIRQTMCHYRQ